MASDKSVESRRQLYTQRLSALRNERSPHFTEWQDISRMLLPYAGRFMLTDRNRGGNQYNKLIDRAATRNHRTLSAGLLAGMTSPARPWFRLSLADEDLMKFQPVRIWLNQVTVIMRRIFERSNTYRGLHSMYDELGAFGTAASFLLEDYQDVIRHYPLTAGEYLLATNERNEVDTVYREFTRSVVQLVKMFGVQNVSPTVRDLYDRGALETQVPIVHLVEPRVDRDLRKRDNRNMPFASVYYESGDDSGRFLRESGYQHFPALASRWNVLGGDVYGNGPGNEALGLIKQLQHEQKRKALGIDYMTLPPINAPVGMKNQINLLPGGISYNATPGQDGAKPVFDVRLDLQHLLLDIKDIREQLRETFFADLFLMLANERRSNVTAREVIELHEEKLIMLGPVLERQHNELLKPKIDITFERALRANILPPPPPELNNVELDVEFVSMLAQALRAAGIGNVEHFTSTIGQLATFQQGLGIRDTVFDKINADYLADEYAEMLGVDPSAIVGSRELALVRKQRAKAEQQAVQTAEMGQAAQTANLLGNTPTDGGRSNALTDVISQFSGYSQ